MSNIIDSIRLSGTTYQIQGSGGGGTQAIELTQAQYDALVDKDPNVFYIITDAEAGDLTNYYTKTEVDTALNGKQETLVSGTNIKTINNESILGSGNIDIQGGGGKAVSGGTNISITTGETADTINCTLNLENGTNSQSGGIKLKSSVAGNEVSGRDACAFGGGNQANGINSFVTGYYNTGNTDIAFVSGNKNKTTNTNETLFGLWAVSNGSHTEDANGYSDATLLAVGNGEWRNQIRHNAFEIRQNGDIYIADTNDTSTSYWYQKPMIKLQDALGGGSSYTAGDGIDITNDVISVTGKVDTTAYNTYTAATDTALASKADTATTYTKTEVDTALTRYVTTGTAQDITAAKTFLWSDSSKKPIIFKQRTNNVRLGFILQNSASTNNELATFEFRPDTYTDSSSVKHPLLYLGHYRTISTANAGVPQTMVGFRQYDQKNNAAYHYLMPLPEKAKTPFRLTATFKDYYAPMGFKNGSTMITADDTGVVDLSSELGGLKLKKLTQAEYDALATKDSNTLYVIVN